MTANWKARIFDLYFNSSYMWSAGPEFVFWPTLYVSKKKLERMTREQLSLAFKDDFEFLVSTLHKSRLFRDDTYFQHKSARERCVMYMWRLSQLSDGPTNSKFLNMIRKQLMADVAAAARDSEAQSSGDQKK